MVKIENLRFQKARQLLVQENLSALIVDSPIDLYYFTGVDLSLGRLVITASETVLFVDGRYYELCQKSVTIPVVLTSSYDGESPFGKWWKFAHTRVGFDADRTPYAEYERLCTLKADLIPLRNPIRKIREIKDEDEIEALQKAALLASKGYEYVLSQLKEGISEIEMAKRLEIFWIDYGGSGLSFAPHIAFGEGSSQPHYHVGDRKLKKGDLILIDIGVISNHYHSDMTRVVCFGSPDKELEKIYTIVFEAYQSATALCKGGNLIEDVDRAARSVIEKRGYKEYFPHGLGHGVGLEIHEFPSLRAKGIDPQKRLEPGMVLTIEPGIYLPGRGGVRLEDTLLITEEGYHPLTHPPLSPTLTNIREKLDNPL
jgi:Xaa-Pro aminopeptidase